MRGAFLGAPSTWGVVNGSGERVDARCNYWGDPTRGEGTGVIGTSVSPNVNFTPWSLRGGCDAV